MKMNMMIQELFKDELEQERNLGKEEMVKRLIRKGMPEDEIAEVLDLSIERIRQLADELEVLV